MNHHEANSSRYLQSDIEKGSKCLELPGVPSSYQNVFSAGGHLASAGTCCGVQKGVRRYEPHGIVV